MERQTYTEHRPTEMERHGTGETNGDDRASGGPGVRVRGGRDDGSEVATRREGRGARVGEGPRRRVPAGRGRTGRPPDRCRLPRDGVRAGPPDRVRGDRGA